MQYCINTLIEDTNLLLEKKGIFFSKIVFQTIIKRFFGVYHKRKGLILIPESLRKQAIFETHPTR